MMNDKSFHIITFGCQMNVLDSRWLGRSLRARGWEETDEERARVFIINTCSVREKPEQKVYSLIGRLERLKERRPDAFGAVGGCVAQQLGAEMLERFPFVRMVFGTDQTGMVPDALDRMVEDPSVRLAYCDFEKGYPGRDTVLPDGVELSRHPGQAFVSIMQGCDNFCAYCIVPFVRGRQKSRPSREVLAECRALVDRGVKEITLLGQNVNSFGLDAFGDGTAFAELLDRVAEIPGLKRLRFTTSHPKDIADEVIEAFARHENLCPHLHLPLQSGSDNMLAAMGRGYDTARYLDIVQRLRLARPNISLTSDIIVGFPGETEKDFQDTMSMVRKVGFESSFSFAYSDRPGTKASRMPGKLTTEVKLERLKRLQALQEELTRFRLDASLGLETEVLVEGPSKKQKAGRVSWRGRDAFGRVVNFAPIKHSADSNGETTGAEDLTGSLVKVRITAPKKHSLWGEAAGEP